jgi:hypothetical protein
VRLCRSAFYAGARARYAHDAYAVRHVSLTAVADHAAAPPRPYGHPDLVLADAIAKGVINAREAELIGGTRIDKQSLKHVAAQLDIPYQTAKWQRRQAEPRLVDAILAEEVQTIITPIRSRVPYLEIETDSRRGRRANGSSPTPQPTGKEAGHPAPASTHPRPEDQPGPDDQPGVDDDPSPVEECAPATGPDRIHSRIHTRIRRLVVAVAVVVAVLTALVLGVADMVAAAPCPDTHQLTNVIDNLRNWFIGILVTLAVFYFTVAGIRHLAAGGDPTEIQKARHALKNGAIGFGIAALAPVLVSILKQIVGGTPC